MLKPFSLAYSNLMPTSPLANLKNFQKWNHFCAPFPSPQRFVDAGYLFLIGAALQRRVWMGTELTATYPNNYVLLVAEPGVGKSLITAPIKDVMIRQTVTTADSTKPSAKLLYPISADSTSFESFVNFTSVNMQTVVKKGPNEKIERYFHSSPCFILDEAASIFDKEAHKMATFLLEGWTCSKLYTRRTISRQTDEIHNLCLNLIGGIQPGKLIELSRISILDNGFSRRCLIVYGDKNRFRTDHIEHDDSQIGAFKEVCAHVRTLNKVFGAVTMTPEARDWMRQRFVIDEPLITNTSEYLKYYYPTKQLHVKKLAMAIHFSESADMTIGIEPFQIAWDYLASIEPDMHMAYTGVRDERGTILNRIKHLLRTNTDNDGLGADELYPDLVDIVSYENLLPTLADLVRAGMLIQTRGGKYVATIR